MLSANEAVTAVLAYSNGTPTVKQICNYDDGRVTLVRKIQNIELYIPYQYQDKVATKKSSLLNQLKLEGYSERAMKKRFSCLGHPQSGHAMLSPFFQPR